MEVGRLARTARAYAVAGALLVLVAPSAAEAGYAKRTLKSGSKGRDVKLFQRYLTRAGFRVGADGHYGRRTRRAMRRFERATDRRVDGRATRRDQRVVQKVARRGGIREAEARETGGTEAGAPPQSNPTGKARLGPDGRTAIAPDDAPQEVKDAIDAANEITRKPYRYGGGHGSFEDSGYDCSGAISYALRGGGWIDRPRNSTGFKTWGRSGRGRWVTVYTHSGHAYVVIAGLRFDTSSGGRGERGPRWRPEERSTRGFVARHPAGF